MQVRILSACPDYPGEGKEVNPSGLEPEEAGSTPAALTNLQLR